MCESIERNRREAAEKAAAEAATKTLASYIKNLMKTMNLTAEQAMVALKIPASDYAKYMVMV